MARYQDGDEAAFRRLYERYSGRVMGYLVTRLGNRAAAEDVFQAVFLNLHRNRDRYDRKLPFGPWLFTVARNAMMDHHRGKKPEGEGAVDEIPAPTTDEAVDRESLSEEQKKVISLRYDEDLEFDEIARRLGTSAVNARQLVSRAVKRLRKFYGR
jgi:RNA polymerase sigma-70 factor (ECF subfamily)